MADIANTVTLSTNLNVAPYYDDFNEDKNFHRILFRPGLAVQARELTQMQSILQNQIDRFAEHMFKEGSVVRGCSTNYDQTYYYIKIRDKQSDGVTSVDPSAFVNKTIVGANKNIRALVLNYAQGSEANTPYYKTLFVKYLSANTDGTKYISNNEVITTTVGGLTANAVSSYATGLGSAITVSSGIIFAKDHFIRVDEQTLVLERYSTAPTYKVGFNIVEEIISDSTDSTLLDPASGSYNYAAPGATRLKLTPTLAKFPYTETGANNFSELMSIKSGIVQTLSDKPAYAAIRDYVAQRTADESGNYIVKGLTSRIKEHLKSGNNHGLFVSGEGGNSSFLAVEIDPGKAYVKGYDIEKLVSSRLTIPKATDYVSVSEASIIADYGNYVIVENVVGKWDVNAQSTVTLRDTQANAIGYSTASGTFSGGSLPGSSIGTARVRSINYYSGTPGLPSAQYKLYLSDINITTAGKGFANAQSIAFSAGVGSANGKADIVSSNGKNANTKDPSFDYAVFNIPAKAIKRLRSSAGAINTNFMFNKAFDVSFNISGQSTLNTGDATETMSGSGVLSDSATRDRFYAVMRSTGNTATLTGTLSVTNASNSVTGTGTAFTTQVNPGDIIACSATDTFVVSEVTNNTTLKLVSPASATRAGAFHKRFKIGQVVDLGGVGKNGDRSINITSSTTATLSLNETLNSPTSLNATVITKLNKVDGQEASKSINRNKLVQLNIGNGGGTSYTANTSGPWPLGLSDGFKLISVRKKSGSNFSTTTEGTDVTSHFVLDSGMRDNKYDHARLVKKSISGLSIANSDRLLVTLDYFTHSYSPGKGYFSVDSYPVNDSTAGSDTTKIYTYQIPIFRSPVDGIAYDLRDCIDIRPRVSDTANGVTSLSGISINPLTSTSFDEPSGGLHFSVPGEDISMDLEYYLKRKDLIVLTPQGGFKKISGTPSLSPITPQAPDDCMPIAIMSLPPYPSLAPDVARTNGRSDLASGLSPIKNERYTMRDIGVLRDRIDRLEYYTSLSLLEKDAKELLIQDANGNDRFKNGILVDSFSGHNIGNVYDQDYKIAVDSQKGEARPPFKIDNVELFYKGANSSFAVRTNVDPNGTSRDPIVYISNSQVTFSNGEIVTSGSSKAYLRFQVDNKLILEDATGAFTATSTITGPTSGASATISSVDNTTPGDLITLPYVHRVFVDQPYASTTRNLTGNFYNFAGVLTLDPDNDYWTDTTKLPDVCVNFDSNADNWTTLANAWGTQWNDWQTVVTGQNVVSTRDVVTGTNITNNISTETFQTEQTIEVSQKQTRSGTQLSSTPYTTTQSTGSMLKDVNIQPYMRSRVVRFSAIGMKPNTRLYSYFDGINVTTYITPTNSSFANTGSEGSRLTSDSSGNVYGLFRIPSDNNLKFRTGEKKFRLTDNAKNSSALGLCLTSSQAIYSSQGLATSSQDTTMSTRNAQLAFNKTSDNQTLTSSATNITGSGQKTVGQVEIPAPIVNNITNVSQTIINDTFVTVNTTVNEISNVTNITNNNITNEFINNDYITNNYATNINNEYITNTTVIASQPTPTPEVPPVVVTTPWQEPVGEPVSEGGPSQDGGDGGGDDPIAQSFLVNMFSAFRQSSIGGYLTKVDIFFASKDPTFPVTVELREVDVTSGALTTRVVPFGRATLYPADISVSDDGSKPTSFYFPSPVYLQNDREYGFVVRPAGNNPNYSVYVARLGEDDLLTGNRISSQPASGMLFASANDRTYSPIQEEDMKFRIYFASFNMFSQGSVVFKNEDRDYMSVANVSSAFNKVGEVVHGETILKGVFVHKVGTGTVNNNVCFVQGMQSGATATVSSNTRMYSGQLTVKNVSTTAKFRGGEAVRIRNTNATTGVIVANSSGGITSATTPIGSVMYYDSVTASNTYLHLANTSYVNSGPAFSNNRMFTTGTYIRGQTDGATARIISFNDLKADVIQFTSDFIAPSGSELFFTGKFATSTSTRDTSFSRLNVNDSTEFSTSRYVLSRSVESNTSASSSTMAANRSFEVKAQMKTNNRFVSPVLDVKRISMTTIENLINSNSAIGSSEDYVKVGGNAKARYITRKVTLADGQDAEDLKVFLTAYKPPTAGVFVYYKVLHREDSDSFVDSRWIPMTLSTANTVVSDSENNTTFKEYEYNVPTYGNTARSGANTNNSSILEYRSQSRARFVGFKYFAIKVVLTDESSSNPPRVADLRVIALQR
jgi:hypothetical protein